MLMVRAVDFHALLRRRGHEAGSLHGSPFCFPGHFPQWFSVLAGWIRALRGWRTASATHGREAGDLREAADAESAPTPAERR